MTEAIYDETRIAIKAHLSEVRILLSSTETPQSH